ncbi:MAG: GNAT family N-acetyltransferase [Campylobacterota bacterium]
MIDIISITINNRAHLKLLELNFDYVKKRLDINDVDNLAMALNELFENILFHSYKNMQQINLSVKFILSVEYISIELHDRGMPFDFNPYLYESIENNSDHSKGFYHIYDLVEYFTFSSLEDGSKRFVLTQSLLTPYTPISQEKTVIPLERDNILENLDISTFKDEDAEGIAQLIYKNYDYTYYKSRYYNPQKILKDNRVGKIISIVCRDHSKIVGHFALVKSKHSNIAEIAIAIVDPLYKRLGIMNLMFNTLIEQAKEHSFSAIYGEGMMIHPYSQKANLRHNMIESAIALGEVTSSMEIEHSIKSSERSGVVMAFLLFDSHERKLNLPKIYAKEINKVYLRAGVKIETLSNKENYDGNIGVERNTLLNVARIIIDGTIKKDIFLNLLNELLQEQHDMIFADISLESYYDIDATVAMLNVNNFFYSGVLFQFYNSKDYLRLQRKNSNSISDEHLICYSEDTQMLLKFIQNDEQRVKKTI